MSREKNKKTNFKDIFNANSDIAKEKKYYINRVGEFGTIAKISLQRVFIIRSQIFFW